MGVVPARRGVPRPAAVTKPALALAAVSAALFGIAKTTGSGWLIVILAGLGAVVALAVVLPAAPLFRLRVGLSAARDATVGAPLRVRLTLSGTRSRVLVKVGLGGEWSAAASPAEGWLTIVPQRRGIYDAVAVHVRCAAPLGLLWWRRSYLCPLDRALEVGPSPADMRVPPPAGAGPTGHESRSAPHPGDDLVRGAREYRPGDPIKTVHWAASARHGDLMVKELEAAAAPPLTLAVDLSVGGEQAEAVAAWGAGVAVGALDAGIPVTLMTAEPDGPVVAAVDSRAEIGRRLARAVPGSVGHPPAGAVRVVVVDAGGVRW
ncbi:MAG TPA: DUF58 domain-containing protein [Acidimicrobiales bacterium]|nr:DUF58 domain-containing protein [Acidimicrobiales bacterium]